MYQDQKHLGFRILVFLALGMIVFLGCTLFGWDGDDEPPEPENLPSTWTPVSQPTTPVSEPPGTPSVPRSEIIPEDCTYFVSPDGDDGGDGGQASPWESFEMAAESAAPGDTVCFHGGEYAAEEIRLERSGAPEAPITFAAYPGEMPVLDSAGEAGSALIFSRSVSHLRLSGFTLVNFTVWGIEVSGDNHHLQFDHLNIGGGEAGIRFTYGETEGAPEEGPVSDIVFEDSKVHDSVYSAVDCTPGPCSQMTLRRLEIYNTGLQGDAFYGSDGIEFARGENILVEDCYVHDNGGDGIDLNSRDRQGHIQGVVVRRNRVVRNHLNGIKLWSGGRIENNLVWGQGNSAIWAGSFHCDLQILNNTVVYNMWEPSYSVRNWSLVVGYPEELERPEVQLTLANNIIAFNAVPIEGGSTGAYLGAGVQLSGSNNLYFSRDDGEITAEFASGRDVDFSAAEIADSTWASYSGSAHDIAQDPLFVSGWPNVDLHLTPGSPALGAGDPNHGVDHDIDRQPRPAAPDLGAYQSAAAPTGAGIETPVAAPPGEGGSSGGLGDVKNWFYYIDVNLDDQTIDQVVASSYDMVVIDYIPSEENNTSYPMASAIARMQGAEHPKLVLAYIDIGQAEDFRTYWQPGWGIGNPEWIIAFDPDGWVGNYPVAYWWDEYRGIWLGEGGYLDGILEAGFDGVYLDWIEAYSDENVIAFAEGEGVDPRQEMIWWVGDIAAHLRAYKSDAIVIAQNAAELARDDEYVEIINAIAQEQVWFDGGADNIPPGDCPLPATDADIDTPAYYASLSPECQEQYDQYPDSTLHVSSQGYIEDLSAAQARGLTIFTVDYALQPENIAAAYHNARQLGFIPFASNRFLDQFVPPVP